MDDLYRLAYVSSARHLFPKAELLALLSQARDKNVRLGITGMLLYKEGNFMQLIEGEKTAIHALFAAISADSRHHESVVMVDEPITERSFENWSMGFYDLADPVLQTLPGFSPFMNRSLDSQTFGDDPSGCLALFQLFRGER